MQTLFKMDFNIKPSVFWGVIVSITMMLFLMVSFIWPDNGYRTRIIDGDGRGFYAYLPTLILNRTVDFRIAFEHEKANQPLEYQGHNYHRIDDVYINKFPVGTALMILPFFLLAQLISPWMGLEADGYSLLYQYEVALAALWWLWFGIFFLKKLLQRYKIPDAIIMWLVLLLTTGTNLFHYAFVDVAFSHVYSFAIITTFLFYSDKLISRFKVKYLALTAFLLGWIVLIRPVNVLVVLTVPFFAADGKLLRRRLIEIFGSIKNWLLIIAFFVLGVLPQMAINYLQTGSFVLYGYKGEGFYFLHPHFLDFLFSYRKGWFVYSPVMLLLFPAMLVLFRKSKYRFVCFVAFLLFLTYFFSSWWNWYYGDGFGMRPMVEFYSFFTLVAALWIKELKPLFKKIVLSISIVLAVFNMLQSYQYFKGIIHVDSMTEAAYRYQFLKFSDEYRNVVAPSDEYFYGELSKEPVLYSVNDFESDSKGWNNPKSLSTVYHFSPNHSQRLENNIEYSSSFKLIADEPVSEIKPYLVLKTVFLEPDTNAALNVLFVVDIRDQNKKLRFYKAFPIKRLPDDLTKQWIPAHIGILIPALNKNDILKTYIWNKEKSTVFIDDFEVNLYEIH
jgi:hypothetical protein